ncbi:MAG: lipoate--protein ligase family protein [Candidatus Aenigmarchaeota archaeon]|nr:lipoate--protein ligase family protein [Candidatus Aenigmarchaeota archaeon]
MEKWRLLEPEKQDDSFLKMAKEEAILNSVASGKSPPTLRFYSWKSPAVSIGYFQCAQKELFLDRCRKDGLEIFRRLTGGGAVYKCPFGEMNYSFIAPENHPLIPKDIPQSYALICGAVMKGLENLGLSPTFKPVNDILINGKKVSGNAQTRVNSCLLQHGTILIDFCGDKMAPYLRIDPEKMRQRGADSVADLVTCLNSCSGRQVLQEDVAKEVTRGFEKKFGIRFIAGELSEEEETEAHALSENKYATEKWNFWR